MNNLPYTPPLGDSADDDRRAHLRLTNLRVPIRAKVSFVATDDVVHGWVKNISEGGMFIDRIFDVPVGTEVFLEALVRDGDRPYQLKVRGHVVRFEAAGTAVRFGQLEKTLRDVIRRLVATGANVNP